MSKALVITVMILILAALVATFMIKQNFDRIYQIKQEAYTEFKLITFSECGLRGNKEIYQLKNDTDVIYGNDIKSFVIPEGFKLQTFPETKTKGSSFTYKGPEFVKCADRTIKSFIFYKGDGTDSGDSMESP
mgnify:CR=1 FL=1|jgi:hypothetical protein